MTSHVMCAPEPVAMLNMHSWIALALIFQIMQIIAIEAPAGFIMYQGHKQGHKYYYYYYYQFFQRRVTQKARLPVQGGPLVHKYNTHSTIQNKIKNKHYTITNKQMLYKTNTIQ